MPSLDVNAPNPEAAASDRVNSVSVLNIPISLLTMSEAVDHIASWTRSKTSRYVCVRDVHGVMRAQDDNDLLQIHKGAGMVTPDGMPLVWICRLRGHRYVERVAGADLVATVCARSEELGQRHFFYGGKPGVADKMAAELKRRFPRLQIAGTLCPPFRPLTPQEDSTVTDTIAAAKPDIVWVGLSTPKQEFWMRDHLGRIPGATLIGVGAAFDFYAGETKRSPRWMQRSGLEWVHRLASEPRRLWRRYLILAPRFIVSAGWEHLSRSHAAPTKK